MPTGSKPRRQAGPHKLRAVAGPSTGDPHGYESKYQALFDQASDAIITVQPNGKVDAANQAVEEMTGYLKSELAGSDISILMPAKEAAGSALRSRPLSAEFFKAPGTYEDIAILRKDGYVRYADVSVRLVESDGTHLALALIRDITEKKRMERELITKHTELRNAYHQLERKNVELQAMQETLVQSGKMAALGELSVGIAHELNQPLQGIRGYAQELESILKDYKPDYQASAEISAREIISNVDKMAGIIEYMRAFLRKSNEKYEMVDVHQPIDESIKMLSRQFAIRGIVVEKNYGKNLPQVYANPLQLEQVFINLASNARDAIDSTGRGKGLIWISTRAEGGFVEIIFKDDGVGMNERTKTKAFNPFFSTKEVGKGMGMGLSLSYGILNKLQASIVVESELGKGAAFIIRIPQDFRELA